VGKAALWRVPADHFGTLRNHATDRPSVVDFTIQIGLPVALGAVTWGLGVMLDDVTGAVAGVSIVAGLLFSMAVFLFQLRLSLEGDSRLTGDDYELVDECMKNTLWAILWGLLLALYLVISGAGKWMDTPIAGPVMTGIAIGASLHFVLVIAMCIKRLRRAYERVAARQD
jgi:hypothetical protein